MRSFGVSQATGRRSVPRIEAPLIAILSMTAGDHAVALIDVSRTGARVAADYLPRAGAKLTFRAEKVTAAAEVIWYEPGSCAIEFDIPIAASEVKLLRWLAQLTCSHHVHAR